MPFDWHQAAKPAPDADEVRSLASIVDVVGSRVALRRKGRELVALCPFHEDSTPSMAVITHKGRGFYKCHACGAGGDAIRFVMDFHGVDFAEAVRMIAEGFALPSVPMKRAAKAPKVEEHRYREDCGEVIDAWRAQTPLQRTVEAGQTLGVTESALTAYGFAWCPAGDGSWAFPMHDGEGRVCGIRLREPVDSGAAKWALKGSRAGVFLPEGVRRTSLDRVFVVEGPTDAAALEWVYRDEPVAVIGRASCTGQHQLVVQAVRLLAAREPEVVVIADADGPGVEGANALADDLVAEFARVKVAVPQRGNGDGRGCKDIREFVRNNDRDTAFRLIELKVGARMWHRRRSVK